jgi:hypothetical protein
MKTTVDAFFAKDNMTAVRFTLSGTHTVGQYYGEQRCCW